MTKKKLNTESITNELEGASAFFTRQPQSRSLPQEEPEALSPEDQQGALGSTDDSNQVMQQDSNITSNITILQFFTEEDITALREPAYQAQTFRLTQEEIEWVKDTAYQLSKETRRRKVAQADILRLSLKLFERLLATNRTELLAILERIK